MKEKQLLDYLIAQAKRSGTNTNSREFKEKVLRAKEYISKRQDYLLQQENIKKTAEVMAAEIAKIKISVPEVTIPEIKIPDIKIPDITGLEELKKELQKDLTVKGVEEIESDILGILSVTEKIMQAFDKPIPVVLVSPGGKEYEAQGSGGGVTGDLAKEKTLKDIKTATEATESTLEDIETVLDDIKTGVVTNNPFSGYGKYDVLTTDPTYYYKCFQNASDAWIIVRIRKATSYTTTYAKGTSGTAAAWAAYSSQTYQDYASTF